MIKNLMLKGASRRSILKQAGAAAIGMTFAGPLAACSKGGAGGRFVSFYNWDTYIGETTLADFEHATTVPVHMDLFSTNDELFAKLRAGNPGYDVVVPSNEFVTRMSQAQMIQPLDHAKLPNFQKDIDPAFQDAPFDPGRRYSMPYTWLTQGIAWNKTKVPAGFVPDSWKWLFDSDRFHQRIAVVSESADLIRIAAKYMGHSVNAIPDDMLSKIEQMFIKQKPHIKAFHHDDGQDLLQSGEVDLVMEYNGDIAQLMAGDGGDKFDFVVPKEGSLLNQDTLCIPTGAPHLDDAHAFINYLIDAEAGKKITETILYPTPNKAARDLMPESYKNNLVIFPPADQMAKCEYGAFEGDAKARQYEEIFTRISAA
ncbi:MAG TPA: spermidine/putrescine ABC transporter substrate-binding protein [Vitreimonas sp.]|jgi:spermidine/putrescine transport system substrate-binding protein|nr:spermidine/putrescine ABC transporter substrate-binding protein [Vitreimonas sp.]